MKTTSDFRAEYTTKVGKCPSKKDDRPAFKVWRTAFRKAITAARKAGAVAPKNTRDGAEPDTSVMLGGKPFTQRMADRFVEMTGGVWDPAALRACLVARNIRLTPIDPLYKDADNVRVEMLCTMVDAPKAMVERSVSPQFPQFAGKDFTKRSARAIYQAWKVAPVGHSPELMAAMQFHGFMYVDGNPVPPVVVLDPAKAPDAVLADATAAQPAPETPKPAALPSPSGKRHKLATKKAASKAA